MRWARLLPLVTLLAGCGEPPPDPAHAESVRTFLQGSEAFQRSVELQAEARRPGGDAEAFKAALKRAEDALAYWQWAAATRADWPQARRNVERALLHMEGLRERVRARTKPKDRPDGGETDTSDPPLPAPKPETADLPPGKVLSLFGVLRTREQEKLRLRRAQRRVRSASVERDW